MTGIERLYKLIADIDVSADPELWYILRGGTEGDWDCEKDDDKTLDSTLAAIAIQIEREQGGRVSRMRVLSVVTDMERHVSGVEGMEDSPVARWARELREALGGNGRDHAADVSVSAYDLLPEEEREAIAWVRYHGGRDEVRMELDNLRGAIAETCARLGVERSGDLTADAQGIWRAIDRLKSLLGDSVPRAAYDLLPDDEREAAAWVRKHGGLDAVKRRWECLSYYADPVPRSCMEKRLARLQRQIDECHAALRRRNKRIEELGHRVGDLTRENAKLRKRAMPEGFEWPTFESGESVMLGDSVTEYVAGGEFEVRSIEFRDGVTYLREGFRTDGIVIVRPGERVKRPAPKVLDADGVEIREGDTVWPKYPSANRDAQVKHAEVVGIQVKHGRVDVRTVYATGLSFLEQVDADRLTHRKPALAADGKPLREGETVWYVKTGEELFVSTFTGGLVNVSDKKGGGLLLLPSQLTHQRPVLDADGVPIREGDTVWLTDGSEGHVVLSTDEDAIGNIVTETQAPGLVRVHISPRRLTHERPDSWERLEEDAGCTATKYNERRGTIFTTKQQVARDLVRRCRALAERERGE